MVKPDPDHSQLEAGVLREVDALVRELRGSRGATVVEPDASLEKDLGLGSLERVELVARLEKRFHAKVSERALGEAETPRDLADAFLRSETTPETGNESAEYQPSRLPPPMAARTLGEVLAKRAQGEPDVAHLFLREDGKPERTLSLGELYSEALTIAGGLRGSGLEENDKVAIMLPTSRDFFTSFMGVVLAGGVPVPLYPPFSMARLQEYATRQAGIVANADARLFVTLERGLTVGAILKARVPGLREVITVRELVARSTPVEPLTGRGESTALIQYTSGSTGDPKGVELSHESLLANIRVIGDALAIAPTDVGVSWLPLYHDMGLIGAWLTPLYFGIPVSIFSPLAFLARPERWLWTIHTRRGTISPAPNFAYELCVRKIADEDLEGLDLSSWRVALNGAEPVSPETLERFTHKFAPHGFRRESFLPVYGLAESSLLLASPELGVGPRVTVFAREALEKESRARPKSVNERGLSLVSVGKAVPGHDVRIADAEGAAVPEGCEGAVSFRGPSAMKGYYANSAATDAIRRDERFFDTGDRGFVFDGELFITGRSKDIIIRAGRNLMPQEIEKEVAEIEGVRRGSVAAFGVADDAAGTEKLVIVAESRGEDAETKGRLEREIASRVVANVGVPPDEVVLVPPRTIPKTSSGKIRRSACREQYIRRELAVAAGSSWSFWARAAALWSRARMSRLLSRLGRLAFGGYVFSLSAAFVLVGWLIAVVVPSRRFLQHFVRRAARVYLKLVFVRLAVKGEDHLAHATTPAVVVANHASYLDPIPVMAALPMDYAFVVKREAASWPFIGTFIEKLGHLPVERIQAEESAKSTAEMRELLSTGRSVVLFPEGTFSYATGIRPFKLGAFQLAAESGCPLVPVALVGTRRWLRDGTWIPRRGEIEVVIGEPRTVSAPAFSDVVRFKEETAELIARHAGEPRLDLTSAGPGSP